MQSFHRQLQGSTCNGSEAQTEEKEKFQELRKEQQGTKCSNWEKISEICKKQEKEENGKRTTKLSRKIFQIMKAKRVS